MGVGSGEGWGVVGGGGVGGAWGGGGGIRCLGSRAGVIGKAVSWMTHPWSIKFDNSTVDNQELVQLAIGALTGLCRKYRKVWQFSFGGLQVHLTLNIKSTGRAKGSVGLFRFTGD